MFFNASGREAITAAPEKCRSIAEQSTLLFASAGSTRLDDARAHPRSELDEQRMAAESLDFRFARRAGGEAGKRRGQHVHATETHRDVLAHLYGERALLRLGARDFEERAVAVVRSGKLHFIRALGESDAHALERAGEMISSTLPAAR